MRHGDVYFASFPDSNTTSRAFILLGDRLFFNIIL